MYTSSLLATIAAASLITTTTALINEYIIHEEFNKLLSSHDRHLVLFTSRSLASVQSHTTIFNRADRNSPTHFTTVDCDAEPQLCNDHDINTYPTIRLLEASDDEQSMHMTRYRGPREERAIRGFVKRREVPVVTAIEPFEIDEFTTMDDVVVVAYLNKDSDNDKDLLHAFTSVASQRHFDYIFGYTTDASLASTHSVSRPCVKVFKNMDDEHRVLSGLFTEASLSAFLDTAVVNAVRDFREKDVDAFMQRDKLTVYVFTSSSPSSSTAAALRRDFMPLARKYEKYVTFAIADLAWYEEMANNFLGRFGKGLSGTKMGLVVHAPLNDNVFLYELGRKIEPSVVEKMLMTILQGKAKSGDIFGTNAPGMNEEDQDNEHDEL